MSMLSIEGLKGSGFYGNADADQPKPEVRLDLATERQTKFIRTLLDERSGLPEAEKVRDILNVARQEGGVTKKVASKAIEALLSFPRVQAKADVGVKKGKQPGDPNAFPGKCEHCGRKVEANEGVLAKSDDNRWVVTHPEACPSDFPFPEGRYAVEIEGGAVKFFHAIDGNIYVMGSDNEYLLRNPKSVKEVVAMIAVDPLEASKRYGIEFEQCGVCGRGLTSDWRKVGIGPVCARKMGLDV